MQNEGLAAAASAAVSKKAKAQVKRDIKRAIKPAAKPVKEALHSARKWTDKTFHKVPVLGNLASLPIDVADDIARDILPETGSKIKHHTGKYVPDRLKWQLPELVDKLNRSNDMAEKKVLRAEYDRRNQLALTSNKMAVELNPGPPKHRKGKGKSKPKHPKKKGRISGKRLFAKNVTARITRRRKLKFKNKRTGATQRGYRMTTSEYSQAFTIPNTGVSVGDEVFANGLLINPHELKLPELNIEVQRWELFRITPKISIDGVTSTAIDGQLIGYFDPDPTDTLPESYVSRFQVAEAHGGHVAPITSNRMVWKPNSKRTKASPVKWFYCDGSGTDTGADIRQRDQYRFRLMIYKLPIIYNTSGGAGSKVQVPMNMRISYTIDFRNRTLDSVSDSSTGAAMVTAMEATNYEADYNNGYFGVASQVSTFPPAKWTVSSSLYNNNQYLFNYDGTHETLYRVSTKPVPKYVTINFYVSQSGGSAAITGGTGAIAALGNCTELYSKVSLTSSNTHMATIVLKVTDESKLTSASITTPTNATWIARTLQGGINPGTFSYGWFVQLNNFSSYVVGTSMSSKLEIAEYDDGPQYYAAKRLGPATVEGQMFKLWDNSPERNKYTLTEFANKQRAIQEDKDVELEYWKRKAKGQDIERKERKLSLTPTPSDDEDDWLAYQQQKAAMHKSPGIIGMKPLKIVQDDEKSERGVPRPKAGSQK